MAQSGHFAAEFRCLLLAVKRTLVGRDQQPEKDLKISKNLLTKNFEMSPSWMRLKLVGRAMSKSPAIVFWPAGVGSSGVRALMSAFGGKADIGRTLPSNLFWRASTSAKNPADLPVERSGDVPRDATPSAKGVPWRVEPAPQQQMQSV